MFNSASHITTARVRAADGDIGPVMDLLLDDRSWVVRYLLVDAGCWLREREVLISPYSIKQPGLLAGVIDVALTRRLVRASPAFDLPVSSAQEQEFMRHYRYPAYWDGGGLWALGATPYPSVAPLPDAERGISSYPVGMHLRSAKGLEGFEVRGAAQGLGQVEDLVFDELSWQVRYLVVDTHAWWPGGRPALISLARVDGIDWAGQQIHVALGRPQLKASPSYQGVASMGRDDEALLHANYRCSGHRA
jgi:uncharacterized protein YrrD